MISSHYSVLENWKNKSSAAYAPQSITYLSRFGLGCHYYGTCVSHTSKMKEIEDGYDTNNMVLPNCAFCCLAILCSLIHILIREVVAENQGVFINTMYFKRCFCSRIHTHASRLFSPALIFQGYSTAELQWLIMMTARV